MATLGHRRMGCDHARLPNKRMKRATGPSLRKKHALDVVELIYVVKNNQPVPRTLLKKGKRSATAFADCLRERRLSTGPPEPNLSPNVTTPVTPHRTRILQKVITAVKAGQSQLWREINSLRSELSRLRTEVLQCPILNYILHYSPLSCHDPECENCQAPSPFDSDCP